MTTIFPASGTSGGNVTGRSIVLHPELPRAGDDAARSAESRSAEARLAEAVGLAEAIGLIVKHAETLVVPRIRPATLFGSGQVDRLAELIAAETAGKADGGDDALVVVVDAALTPVQQRNLERAWHAKVIDRTGVILEIFGERARTAEGRLQVELASLTYQRSRLVRSWTHLERQRGGFGFMGGPGESQLETDRRMITDRIARLRRELADVKRTRTLHRSARRRVPFPVVALVGYTNAGKSTLFNRLTSAAVVARDQLFATLDPTMRRLPLPSGRTAILSDTVGFISDLPHELVEAFHATLEEVVEADVVVHVRDAAHVDSDRQKADVHAVLEDLGLTEAAEQAMIEVLNKIDLLSEPERRILANQAERANIPTVMLSAKSGEGCAHLIATLDDRLSAGCRLLTINLPCEGGAALAWLYEHGEVVDRSDEAEAIRLTVRMDPRQVARFEKRFGVIEPPPPATHGI